MGRDHVREPDVVLWLGNGDTIKQVGWLSIACTEQSPHEWADATLRGIVTVVEPGARLTAPEFGALPPVEARWPTAKLVESLGVLMQHYGVGGGDFWVWVWVDRRPDAR